MDRNKSTERINYQIRNVKEVRIIGNNIESRIVTIEDALAIAESMNLDLVEINPNSNPPLVKVVDYSKFLYEKKQREKLQKQKNKKIKVKEIRFTYNTGEHDLNFKMKHAIEFLKEGNKVKAFVFFSGREQSYVDIGNLLLLNFIESLSEYGKPENLPVLEGRRLWTIIAPKK